LGYGEWLHGEAVAAGMVMAAKLSAIDSGDQNRLCALIEMAGLPVAPPKIDADKFLAAMRIDKKVIHKQLRFVLLKSLGEAFVTSSYDDNVLHKLLSASA
jgi:3-dehydroquinate synthase